MGTSTPLGFLGGWDKGLGDLVRGASGHGNIGWNIMMCGCKPTFRVSWGLGQGVGHGTMNIGWNIMMCASTPLGFLGGWDKGLGDLGLEGPRGTGP